MNFKTTLIAIALLTALTSTALLAVVANNCVNGGTDVNSCGTYPPTCILIEFSDQTRECCGSRLRQAVKKEWYYCGNGCTPVPPAITCADCEYDIWFQSTDSTCL